MAKPNSKSRRRAKIAAALTVTFIALFAFAFLGVVIMLSNYADSLAAEDDIAIGSEAPSNPFYVLLIGSDSRKGTAIYTGKENEHAQVDQHSDVMTLMRVDPKNHVVTLVSVPRDTVIEGQNDKINNALRSNNPEDVVKAVGDLTGVYADYYMMTSFISFENLINALGGIDIRVPKTVSVSDPATGKNVTVKAGKNRHLNGSEALVLARARKEYSHDEDALRQMNVRSIERAMIEKVLKGREEIDIEHVLTALQDDTKTNLDLSSVGLLLTQFVEHADEVVIYDCTGPHEGSNREEDGVWVVSSDGDTWRRLMEVVSEGKDPSGIVATPSF